MAEGILRHKLSQHNLPHLVDSAGTSHWHAGDPPDSRAVKTAAQFGVDLSLLRGRQFTAADFRHFDLILPMDFQNLADILEMATEPADEHKVKLFLEFAGMKNISEVPDPYYGGMKDFLDLYRLLDTAAELMMQPLSNLKETKG